MRFLRLLKLISFEKFLAIISSNISCALYSLYSWDSDYMHDKHLIMLHMPHCSFLLLFFFFNLCVSVWIFYWPGFQFSVSVFCSVQPVGISIKWVIHLRIFFISRKAIEFLKNRSQISIESFHIFFHGSYFFIFPLTN